jgi:hypothetical protein
LKPRPKRTKKSAAGCDPGGQSKQERQSGEQAGRCGDSSKRLSFG